MEGEREREERESLNPLPLTASLSSGGFSSIPLMFLRTQTHVSSELMNVSLSMCETRLQEMEIVVIL